MEKRQAFDFTALPHLADDPRPIFERLRDYATRGTDAPETLNLAEIRQACFALSLYLADLEDNEPTRSR